MSATDFLYARLTHVRTHVPDEAKLRLVHNVTFRLRQSQDGFARPSRVSCEQRAIKSVVAMGTRDCRLMQLILAS